MPERPTSPHASIYRLMHTMVLSFLHRIAGLWMAVGLCALVYWLMSAATGEHEYEQATALFSAWYFRVFLLCGLAAFCYHFVNGLRHLAWDAGLGLEKLQARRSAFLVVVVAAAAFLITGYLLFAPRASVL